MVVMGPLTHLTQPCDLHLNSKLKKLMDELVILAPADKLPKGYFVSRSGKLKSGHQFVTMMVLDEILKNRWPITYRSNDMSKTYDQAG